MGRFLKIILLQYRIFFLNYKKMFSISNLFRKLPDIGKVLLVNYVVHFVLHGEVAEHKKQALIYIKN